MARSGRRRVVEGGEGGGGAMDAADARWKDVADDWDVCGRRGEVGGRHPVEGGDGLWGERGGRRWGERGGWDTGGGECSWRRRERCGERGRDRGGGERGWFSLSVFFPIARVEKKIK